MTSSILNLGFLKLLILSIWVVSFFGFIFTRKLTTALSLAPKEALSIRGFYRLVTHAWIHADFTHLFFNSLGLLFYGRYLEQHLHSESQLAFLFFFTLITSAAVYSIMYYLRKVQVIGVSGAVSGLMFAVLFLNANFTIHLWIISIPSYLIVLGFMFIQFRNEMLRRDGIAYGIHMTGALCGAGAAYFISPLIVSNNMALVYHKAHHFINVAWSYFASF
jgi:membrane associated rhomboid family serine protease